MRDAARQAIAVLVALGGLASWSAVGSVPPALAQGPGTVVASTPARGAEDVEVLRQRAAAFWAARIEGDVKAQWELLEPRGRGRMVPADLAPARGAVKYLAYQVEDATVNGYFATVAVRLLVQTILPTASQQPRKVVPSTSVVKESWVRIGGVWYRSLEQAEQ
jgi:hypothetical protein